MTFRELDSAEPACDSAHEARLCKGAWPAGHRPWGREGRVVNAQVEALMKVMTVLLDEGEVSV